MIRKILDKLFNYSDYDYEDDNITYVNSIDNDCKNKSLLEVGELLLKEKEEKKAIENKIRDERRNKINSTLYLTECQFLSYLITYFLNKEAGFLYIASTTLEPSIYRENKYNDYYPRIYLNNYNDTFRVRKGKVFYLNSGKNLFPKEIINSNQIKIGYDNNFYIDINFNFEKQKFCEKILLDNNLCFSIYNELNKFECYDIFENRNFMRPESILSSGNLFYLKRILNTNDKTNKYYLFLTKLQRICSCIKEVVNLEFKLEIGEDF